MWFSSSFKHHGESGIRVGLLLQIKTVNLLKTWVYNNDSKVKARAIRPSEFMGIRLLAFPK